MSIRLASYFLCEDHQLAETSHLELPIDITEVIKKMGVHANKMLDIHRNQEECNGKYARIEHLIEEE